MRIALITSADDTYTPLLNELLASLRQHSLFRHVISKVGIINAGLSLETITALEAQGHVVVDGLWPIPVPESRIQGRTFLKACVSRPFIPELFPDYDCYIWLDADTWVQDWTAIDLLIRGAYQSGLAVIPQVDRAYGKSMRLGWAGPFPWRPRSFYYSNAKKAFDGKTARALFPHPTINAGVFAMMRTAPHWARWQELIKQALVRGNPFTAEQLTLGMLIWLERYPAEFLPATCNWLVENTPKFDMAQKRFTEPFLPHHPIGIMHLSGLDKMRIDPSETIEVTRLDGSKAMQSLRFGWHLTTKQEILT